MCQWSLDLIFEAKLKLESGNWKIQYGRQAAILKVTSLKINRLLAIATNYMHMKFEIEIPRQTRVMLRKPYRLQTDGQTDRQTDKVNPVYPATNFVGRGYMISQYWFRQWLGAVRHEAITCINIVPGQFCHMESLGHNELIWCNQKKYCVVKGISQFQYKLCRWINFNLNKKFWVEK